jgi:hypothetical protein
VSNADRRAERQAAHATALAALLDDLLVLDGHERVLDVGNRCVLLRCRPSRA